MRGWRELGPLPPEAAASFGLMNGPTLLENKKTSNGDQWTFERKST